MGVSGDREKPPEVLSEPLVPASLYDEDYYRNTCAGYAEWSASEGAHVAGIYPGALQLAHFQPGEVLVDIGTGRGEMLAVAVQMGAVHAIGIEYSPAAVVMARQTLQVHGIQDRAEVLLVDARSIPLEGATADLVTMVDVVDVVEHLSPTELDETLQEAYRILKSRGRLFIHTMPTRTIYEVTYRLQRWLRPGRLRSWPRDPRNEYERRMHVNEQTVGRLRRTLQRAGFDPVRVRLGSWVYTDFVPDERAKRLYRILGALRVTARLGIGDLFGEAVKP